MLVHRTRHAVGRGVVGAAFGALVLSASAAGAQPSPTFSAEPTTIGLGEAATFTATGCTDVGLGPDDLAVHISIGSDRSSSTWGEVTPDADGTATFVSPVVEPSSMAGPYEFGAACVDVSGDVAELLFTYDQRVVITVVTDGRPTTSAVPVPVEPTSPSPSVAPAAGAAPATPRFTG